VEGCEGELVEKSSRRGKIFYSCSTYPKCDYAVWNWPVNEACPKCDHPILTRKTTKDKGEHLACPKKGCGFTREMDEAPEGD
jgi:DNA topoisomerase-1